MSDIVVSSPDIVVPTFTDSITVARYIDFCKQYLYTGTHEIRSKLAVPISDTATSFTPQYPNAAFQDNTRISVGLEDMYVWTVDASGSLTVERGQFGSIATSHEAGETIYASPKFSDAEILREINNEISSLSAPGSGLYAVATVDIVTDGSVRAYDFTPVSAMDILDIRVRTPGDSKDWPVLNDWYYEQKANVTDFASGAALFITEPVPTATTLHVTYSLPFSTLSSLTQVVTTVSNLSTTQLELPILGAAINLTAGREIKRNFNEHQGETRRTSEVGGGANLSSANALRARYQTRRVQEANRLSKQFPTRKKRAWNI